MSDFSLHDVLKAEKEAGERIRKADERADQVRRETEKRIAELDKEVTDRIEARRRERMDQVKREIAQAHKAAMDEADRAIVGWEARYRERREAILARMVDMLAGGKKG